MFRVRSCQKEVVRGGCFAVVRGPTDVAIAAAAKFHVRRSHASVTSQSKCVSLTPFLLSPRKPYNSREQIERELLLLAQLQSDESVGLLSATRNSLKRGRRRTIPFSLAQSFKTRPSRDSPTITRNNLKRQRLLDHFQIIWTEAIHSKKWAFQG